MGKNIVVFRNYTGIMDRMKPLFQGEGYELAAVGSVAQMETLLREGRVQMIITDVVMEGQDVQEGLDCISHLRSVSSVPVMVVSDLKQEEIKIRALNAGADDFVSSECNPLVLLARVKSQLRRYNQLVSMCRNIDKIYRIDDLEIDDNTRKVSVGKREVRLTPIEYQILRLLVRERGRVFSIPQIYEAIWHMQAIGADNTIAVHIRHIREKIESNPKQPRYLKVVWGTGYRVG